MRAVGPARRDVTVEDYLDMQATLMRYSTAIDTKNWALVESVFTRDCHAHFGDLETKTALRSQNPSLTSIGPWTAACIGS